MAGAEIHFRLQQGVRLLHQGIAAVPWPRCTRCPSQAGARMGDRLRLSNNNWELLSPEHNFLEAHTRVSLTLPDFENVFRFFREER